MVWTKKKKGEIWHSATVLPTSVLSIDKRQKTTTSQIVFWLNSNFTRIFRLLQNRRQKAHVIFCKLYYWLLTVRLNNGVIVLFAAVEQFWKVRNPVFVTIFMHYVEEQIKFDASTGGYRYYTNCYTDGCILFSRECSHVSKFAIGCLIMFIFF